MYDIASENGKLRKNMICNKRYGQDMSNEKLFHLSVWCV